jgi:hypothetical protein
MATVPINKTCRLPLAAKSWIRNTRNPKARLQAIIAERAGYGAYVRAKPVFVGSSDLANIPASTAEERTRWRFAAHAGPYTQFLYVQFTVGKQSAGDPADCYVRMRVTNRNGVLIGDATRHYGSSATTPSDVPNEWATSTATLVDSSNVSIELPADEDYFVEFTDVTYGRLVAAVVREGSFNPSTEEGWINVSTGAGAPIYDADRADVVAMARTLHKKHSSQLWNWFVDTDAGVRSMAGAPTFIEINSVHAAYQGALTVPWPAHQTGDIGILIVQTEGEAVSLTTAAGFTLIDTINHSDAGWTQLTCYWHRATSSAMASAVVAATLDFISASIMVVRGCVAAGTPWESEAESSSASSFAISIPGGTSTGANALVVAITAGVPAESDPIAPVNADLTDVTARLLVDHGENQAHHYHVITGTKVAAGAYGATTATAADSTRRVNMSFALKTGTTPTYRNPVDDTSTTPSSATPGVKLNMAQHTTMSRAASGCRVTFKAYASSSNSTGSVRLVDDAGATMIDVPITSTTPAWHSAFGYIPASDGEKYDLHFGGPTGLLDLYATSLYEYDQLGEALTGSAAITLGAMTVAATGTNTNNAALATTLGAMTVVATGTALVVAPSYIGAGTAASGAGTLSPTNPTHVSGDILVCAVNNSYSRNSAATLATANGFAAITDQNSGLVSGLRSHLTLFWKRAASGAESAPVIDDCGELNAAQIYCFRGCVASGNPWDVFSGAGDIDTSLSIAGTTTTGANRLVAVFVGAVHNSTASLGSWANADLTAIAEQDDTVHTIGGDKIHLAMTTGAKAAAGAYGATTATWTGIASFVGAAGITLALKP